MGYEKQVFHGNLVVILFLFLCGWGLSCNIIIHFGKTPWCFRVGTTLVYHFEEGKCAHRILRFAQNDRRVRWTEWRGGGHYSPTGSWSVAWRHCAAEQHGNFTMRFPSGKHFLLRNKVPKETLFGRGCVNKHEGYFYRHFTATWSCSFPMEWDYAIFLPEKYER